MENKIIELNDNFKTNDSFKPRGFVYCYDENGNLIFKKENMIVKTGRKYILEHGLNIISNSPFIGPFTGAYLSSTERVVSADDTFTTGDDNYVEKNCDIAVTQTSNAILDAKLTNLESATFVSSDITGNYFKYTVDSDNLVIKCLIVFGDSTPVKASSMGLIVDTDMMFSRLTFPTYYKSEDQKLIFKYYIYL